MVRSAIVSVGLVVLATGLIGRQHVGAQEERLKPIPDHGTRTVTWNDQEGEAGYRVSGMATYWPEGCDVGGPGEAGFVSEEVEFAEQLPADTTTYQWPSPQNQSLTFVKGVQITVEALGQDGALLARDGVATTAEVPSCDETSFPLTGGGEPEANPRPFFVVVLLALGASSLVGGAIGSRRRA